MYDLNKDAAPESVTSRDVIQVCRNLLTGAAAVGFFEGQYDSAVRFSGVAEADEPTEVIACSEAFANLSTGDDPSPNDSEALVALFENGLDSVKTWAKDMNRFYNSEKLADITLECFHAAYTLGRGTVSPTDVLHQLAVSFNGTL